ncbi:HECT-domain-containing protein [Anaeromyces robustus]|uniref:HECT-type E3 ubiquitin transferase n=1 Tax=Anaeromyces robustus TaxID=1754192 RepID=A0A1Y1XGC1_9FUNG|nr:HECT-domain-containing protein [Anaeromyces robustus]|eukprot:ORX84424.1 HECT-domain-containing protein [Anaeromyces robustus]
MSLFLNNFCFQMYWQESAKSHRELLESAQLVLNILYDKNDRRPFSPDMNWTVKEIRHYTFLENIKKKDEVSLRILESMPHVIPFKVRVEILRNYIKADKDSLIKLKKKEFSIRRTMILEDGFEQLGHLNTLQFKQTIRIKFISAHGYEEAGIDQNGVFKEFLEELCKSAFDPALNLFKTTSEGYCSPSPTSYIHENYLSLFEFIGKILGKALYEAIVIDFPFAQFFYAKLLSRYNFLDDLPSLDPQLYKNLTFLKHYDGNCEDLGLTFTIDQDIFGKINSIDIKPGGSRINVTNDNRFQYIYLVADYMLNQQCKEQNRAFIKGFKSIISEKWLKMFSPAELQKLISGESMNIDIDDLRKYTNYEGGYFDQHKTIRNLWSVLNSFSEKEKQLFLKFTTSCSKPPVGGFEYLNPPLTIRFVPMDEEGNVDLKPLEAFKSVFGLAKDTTRLPTASTCFNLLKLPPYQKKSTLKEKLKYAINAGAGFELS